MGYAPQPPDGKVSAQCASLEMLAKVQEFELHCILREIAYNDLIKGEGHRTRWCCMYFPASLRASPFTRARLGTITIPKDLNPS